MSENEEQEEDQGLYGLPWCTVRGDPRMNRAVAARLKDPNKSLADCLRIGGFNYPTDDNSAVDEDEVTLTQRKNQLNRRVRSIRKRKQHAPSSQDASEDLESFSNNKIKKQKPDRSISNVGESPALPKGGKVPKTFSALSAYSSDNKTATASSRAAASSHRNLSPPSQPVADASSSSGAHPGDTTGSNRNITHSLTHPINMEDEEPPSTAELVAQVARLTQGLASSGGGTGASVVPSSHRTAAISPSNGAGSVARGTGNTSSSRGRQLNPISSRSSNNNAEVQNAASVPEESQQRQAQHLLHEQSTSHRNDPLSSISNSRANLNQLVRLGRAATLNQTTSMMGTTRDLLALQIFQQRVRDLQRQSMIAAGFPPEEALPTTEVYNRIAFRAWDTEGGRLQDFFMSSLLGNSNRNNNTNSNSNSNSNVQSRNQNNIPLESESE